MTNGSLLLVVRRFYRNYLTLLIFSLSLANLIPNSDSRTASIPEIKATIEELVQDQFLPQSKSLGLGLAVVNRDGSLVYSNGFGVRDATANLPVTSTTLFPVAMLTASFVSSMIVKILSEKFPQYGESVLEMPIRQLVPSYELVLADRFRTEETSFRDLLSQRSCSTSNTLGILFGAVNGSKDHIYRSRYEEPICPFRTEWVFSTTSYAIAGDVIGEIAGKPFEQLCQDFLSQLGMADSTFFDWQDDLTTFKNLAQGHYIDTTDNGKLKKINPNFWRVHATLNAAGGLLTTPKDMSRFLSFMLNHGMIGGNQVVSKEAMEWLTRHAVSIDNSYSYGLGLILQHHGIVEQSEGPILVHHGYCAPIYSLMTIDPSSGLAVFSSSTGPTDDKEAHYDLHRQIILSIISHFDDGSNQRTPKLVQNSPKFPSDEFGLILHREFDATTIGTSKLVQKVSSSRHDGDCSGDAIIGYFGNPVNGHLEIFRGDKMDALKITYGSHGIGFLTRVIDCKYRITWTNPDFDTYYRVVINGGEGVKPVTDILELHGNYLSWTIDERKPYAFERDLTLEKLPQVPFSVDISCENGRNDASNFKIIANGQKFTCLVFIAAVSFLVF